MWASAQRHRTAPLNVMVLAWRVKGPLRVEWLEAALGDVVARHPTLRARLTMRGGQLQQEVLVADRVSIRIDDSAGSGAPERINAAIALLREGGRQVIDVVSGPPLVARLVRLDADDHVFCLYVHHAMCDGWSSQIIIHDLAKFYEARAQGRIAELPPLVEQYADSAQWQIDAYESGGFSDEIRYWKAELADPAPALALPTTGVRKGNRDFLASSPLHSVPLPVLTALRGAARQSRVSTFAVVLAGVSVLMHQRTGADDFIVGVPTLNRWSSKAKEFVGCATSLLPARVRPRPTMPFGELCVQIHATIRRMLAYGRVPLELILRETQDSPLGGPVIPVWCQIRESAPTIRLNSMGLSMDSFLIERGTILADLDVDMIESEQGLLCEFAHRPSLFALETIHALMVDFGDILCAAAHAPHLPIADLIQHLAHAKKN